MKISKELHTSRLILRQLDENFFDEYSLLLMNDETNRFSDWPTFEKSDDDVLLLAIVLKLEDVFIGSCGLQLMGNQFEYKCFYALLPQYWGKGYAIESIKRIFEYTFDELDAKIIHIYLNPKNTRAWKVAEHSGMKYLGQFKLNDMDYHQMYFTIEKRDYKTQRYY